MTRPLSRLQLSAYVVAADRPGRRNRVTPRPTSQLTHGHNFLRAHAGHLRAQPDTLSDPRRVPVLDERTTADVANTVTKCVSPTRSPSGSHPCRTVPHIA